MSPLATAGIYRISCCIPRTNLVRCAQVPASGQKSVPWCLALPGRHHGLRQEARYRAIQMACLSHFVQIRPRKGWSLHSRLRRFFKDSSVESYSNIEPHRRTLSGNLRIVRCEFVFRVRSDMTLVRLIDGACPKSCFAGALHRTKTDVTADVCTWWNERLPRSRRVHASWRR